MRAKQEAFVKKMLAVEAAKELVAKGSSGSGASDATTEVDGARDCLICTNPLTSFAFGNCDHCQICVNCVIKKRVHFGDYACVMCKSENATMVVVPDPPEKRGYDTYELSKLEHVKPTGCYFANKADATAIRRKLSRRCPICVANGDGETV